LLLGLLLTTSASASITHDAVSKHVIIADDEGKLALRLSYDGQCVIDRAQVLGQGVLAEPQGAYSAIKIGNHWFTSRSDLNSPKVSVSGNRLTVRGIHYGSEGLQLTETWTFSTHEQDITWRIDRTYLSSGRVEDSSCPAWAFANTNTWTGALLGHGGVAWLKLFDQPGASYGVHTGELTFWNRDSRVALRIRSCPASARNVAVRFTRETNEEFCCNFSLSDDPLTPRHGLSRFLQKSQDVWAPFSVRHSTVSVEYTLAAMDYDQAYDPGISPALDTHAIREISHTIARIGAVDELIHGSNGYYSDVAVLHEPWIAQLGLLIDDPAYTRALADTLDFQRLHAIAPDGRVKSRWAGTPGDAMPGTYDRFGYYEAQWGYLMDSQPSWVINVAELFDLNGDRRWLQRQKTTCERVLDYLLRRDSDGDGLVEMMTASEKEARGSDWLDVIWAAYENALVNAQMYWALTHWADREATLGDQAHAHRYRTAALKLKQLFNQSTAEGGFWDSEHQCYAYWRDKDDSIHGTNLVVPVNFSAIGYGLCDDPARRAGILHRIESLMQEEGLFFWPLCFFPFSPGEAHPSQYPFPTYENGDLFLAWGELGTRAYAAQDPAVAVKYVKNVLAQYDHDGLAFQRYLRKTQTGTGGDILANNCSTIVGLYRNLYGIQPRPDRLYLEPHLAPELNGTRLTYFLRGQTYALELNTNGSRLSVEDFYVRSARPFALAAQGNRAEYFFGDSTPCAMSVARTSPSPVAIQIDTWSADPTSPRRWTQTCCRPGIRLAYTIAGLAPDAMYHLERTNLPSINLRADSHGRVRFRVPAGSGTPQELALIPQG
jgi:hypothetical protein